MNAMTQARTIMNGAFDMAWEKEHASREWHRQRDPRIEQLIDEHFNPTELSRMRALDLGCGSGANAFPLARKGFIVDAVDGSESAIRRCLRFKVDEINTAERINFSLGDVTNLPYSDGIFDLVIDVATLECLEWDDGRRAVAEV